ncbi:MAG TPA: DUF3048 domain-containing protein [Actinomycetota bacterium]
MSTRGKAVLASISAVIVVAAAGIGYLMFTGQSDAIPFLGGTREPERCPLTGEEAANPAFTGRTVLAVKIENSPESRPQAGLNQADVVYEEPVEGGITRFIALYHCETAERVGPIRSARFVDPVVLRQFGPAVFAYSGGIPQVIQAVADAGLQDVGYDTNPDAYTLDPSRSAPHNVYSSTRILFRSGSDRGTPPEEVFEFDEEPPAREGSRRARELHLDFSPSANVYWRYQRSRDRYVRLHDETPHTSEDGEQVSAANVVVMEVELRDTGIVDAAGNPSPEVVAVGSGRAWVFRNGRVIRGRWERGSEGELTRLVDRGGDVIPLAPGRTWVELFPNDLEVEIG